MAGKQWLLAVQSLYEQNAITHYFSITNNGRLNVTKSQKKGPIGSGSEIFNGIGRMVKFRTTNHSLCRTYITHLPKFIRSLNNMTFGFVVGHTRLSISDPVSNLRQHNKLRVSKYISVCAFIASITN